MLYCAIILDMRMSAQCNLQSGGVSGARPYKGAEFNMQRCEANITAAIFDLDGTITDSMYLWDELPRDFISRHGGTPPADLAQIIAPMQTHETLELMHNFLPEMSAAEIGAELNREIRWKYEHEVQLKAGVDKLIEYLRARGIRLGVLSATDSGMVSAALKRLNMLESFEFVAISEDWGGKTKPECFIASAKRLGAKPETTLVFEDALHALSTAADAGFRVVGVYDAHSAMHWQEICRRAEWHIRSYDSLNYEG